MTENKWVITLLIGVVTLFITGWGQACVCFVCGFSSSFVDCRCEYPMGHALALLMVVKNAASLAYTSSFYTLDTGSPTVHFLPYLGQKMNLLQQKNIQKDKV